MKNIILITKCWFKSKLKRYEDVRKAIDEVIKSGVKSFWGKKTVFEVALYVYPEL